jgi:hypothetical protein
MAAIPNQIGAFEEVCVGSALARLEPLLGLVDDVDAALATHDPVVPVAIAKGFERVADFHGFTGITFR